MELRIKQRVFSWSDTYDVYDESGEPRYYVEAELFAFGHQIHVYDKRSGQEVGSIHQKLFTFLPQFEIVIGGRTVGTMWISGAGRSVAILWVGIMKPPAAAPRCCPFPRNCSTGAIPMYCAIRMWQMRFPVCF